MKIAELTCHGLSPIGIVTPPKREAALAATISGFHPLYTGVNYVGDVFGLFVDNSLGTLATYNVNSVAITAGFGIDADYHALPVTLEVRHELTHLGCILACQPRDDLCAAGLGLGQSGFVFTPPAGLGCSGSSVLRPADGALLPNLPESCAVWESLVA